MTLGGDRAVALGFILSLAGWGAVGRIEAKMAEARSLRYLENQAKLDENTGALSKQRILEAMDREVKAAKRKASKITMVLIEALNIMEINAKFDRLEGDKMLAAIAMASSGSLRDTDYLGRTSGLIFCVLLPETDEREAVVVYERLKTSLSEIARSHQKGEIHPKCRLVKSTWNGEDTAAEWLTRVERVLPAGEMLTA
jgi:diguanylate cyclase (GGDEF)-like protein